MFIDSKPYLLLWVGTALIWSMGEILKLLLDLLIKVVLIPEKKNLILCKFKLKQKLNASRKIKPLYGNLFLLIN